MAFTSILRKSASTMARRVVGSQARKYSAANRGVSSHHFCGRSSFQPVGLSSFRPVCRSSFLEVRSYSSRPSSDISLLKVIESEVECAEESNENGEVDEVPSDFPFKIQDNPGQQTITLTRQYQDETITVEVYMPDLSTPDEEEENDGNDNDDDAAQDVNSRTELVVRISKKTGGPVLEFGCSASPDEIVIDSLAIKNETSSDEDQLAYEGPDFSDLDENLQNGFHKYLEIRGIKPSTTNYLNEYMVDKDNREYINWLKNLKRFVEA
ncbi:uncharacterized protein At2g39795, mitochondrial-like [Impatiens glandulifera]|uniref:uncharacterized protein At2g39795, mitochondrial-like n=1 Tax=Impatiens glandulifera TaxID=253017 RepID=UPI001FB10B7A|nr:uncharacterized protein At2g39795, mitochondrial-like [Impatiens glandulifera]